MKRKLDVQGRKKDTNSILRERSKYGLRAVLPVLIELGKVGVRENMSDGVGRNVLKWNQMKRSTLINGADKHVIVCIYGALWTEFMNAMNGDIYGCMVYDRAYIRRKTMNK